MFEVVDDTYTSGKVGLMADAPTYYDKVTVTATPAAKAAYTARAAHYRQQQDSLLAANPKMVVWEKIATNGFGVGPQPSFWRS